MLKTIALFALPILIGAVIGALMGATRSCEDGGCPLTANPWRGGLYGAILGLLFSLGSPRPAAASTTPNPANTEESLDMSAIDLSATVHLSDASFATATASGLVLVDFWAPWCGPCRMLGPVIDKLAADSGPEVMVAKVNVDENPATAQRFSVSSIPTMILLKDGAEVDRRVGVQPAPALLAWIDANR